MGRHPTRRTAWNQGWTHYPRGRGSQPSRFHRVGVHRSHTTGTPTALPAHGPRHSRRAPALAVPQISRQVHRSPRRHAWPRLRPRLRARTDAWPHDSRRSGAAGPRCRSIRSITPPPASGLFPRTAATAGHAGHAGDVVPFGRGAAEDGRAKAAGGIPATPA